MLIDSYEALRGKRVVLLYSGGLDTVYMALKLREHGAAVTALKVLLGENTNAVGQARNLADFMNVEYVEIDKTQNFVEDYLKPALLNGYFADGMYPVSASISFPLIAKTGVEVSREIGAVAVCHGSDVFQNSMTRFNRSIAHLAPDLGVAALSLIDDASREVKQQLLEDKGIDTSRFQYSVDGNLWCSCVEGGEFDFPDTPADFGKFSAEGKSEVEAGFKDVAIFFESGLPVALGAKQMPLGAIIAELNDLGASYSLGRFSSWEDTATFKAREIRLAPAAEILHTALTALVNCSLALKEKEVRSALANVWLGLVLRGDWYGDLAQAITSFNRSMSGRLSGNVTVRIFPNKCLVLSANGPGLHKHLAVKSAVEAPLMKAAHAAFARLSEIGI